MRYRSYLSLALFAAATACSAVADSPTAVQSSGIEPTMSREGLKPPPPLGTQETSIYIDSPSSETPFGFEEARVSSATASAQQNRPFSSYVLGRYFANTQYTNGWIAFTSDECVTASANAKLQYNEKTGRTNGSGTLTLLANCGGEVVLDLSKIEITSGGFGDCTYDGELYSCRYFEFSYDGIPGGYVNVGYGE